MQWEYLRQDLFYPQIVHIFVDNSVIKLCATIFIRSENGVFSCFHLCISYAQVTKCIREQNIEKEGALL